MCHRGSKCRKQITLKEEREEIETVAVHLETQAELFPRSHFLGYSVPVWMTEWVKLSSEHMLEHSAYVWFLELLLFSCRS